MATVPGSAGFPLVGDRSYDFYKDPVKFQEKHIESAKSRVFLSRFLNKPTIFIGSNEVLRTVLSDGAAHMDLGYKAFMGEIYGDNILFNDGDTAMGLRHILSHLFTTEAVASYHNTIDRIVRETMNKLDCSQPICFYTLFKKLALEICLSLFLGMDFKESDDTANILTELTTTHWHGIISVPVAVRLPMMNSSTYSQALEAKEKLLDVIKERRRKKTEDGFPEKVEHLPDVHDAFVDNHLLLFTSALVPKAISSIFTSFAMVMGKPENIAMQKLLLDDDDLFECVILELLRLYPPFFGGRRLIRKDFTACGYKMPAGHAVIYLTYSAHRDPKVFENPDDFKPGRWQTVNKDDRDKLVCFGSGPRQCLGQTLVWYIIKTVLTELLRRFHFSVREGQDIAHKWLPVARPKGELQVQLEPRQTIQTEEQKPDNS